MKNSTVSCFCHCKKLLPILEAIKQKGGISYLVGGSVRDLVLDRNLKDFDIEIHKLTLEELEKILESFRPVILVGKKFGVLRVAGFDVDWSLPRRDSKGRRPTVIIDPSMTIQEACRRRDLTMNAMAIDLNRVANNFDELYAQASGPAAASFDPVQAFEIIDPFGGLDDIKNKRLRVVDEKLFLEDPLRFYRVMQFIGRFEMEPDEHLNNLCATMDLHDTIIDAPLSRERIFEEIKKLFLKSKSPSLGFRWLARIGRLQETFPELYDLIGVEQRSDFHPEGDVFEHTMQSLDAAARLDLYEDQSWGSADDEKFLIMIGMLCHDLGKVITTDEKLSAKRHEEEGVPLAKSLLKQITNSRFLIKAVCKLVRYHMRPLDFIAENSGPKAYKRLAIKLDPEVTLRQLGLVALSDKQGRNRKGHEPLKRGLDLYELFVKKAEDATVAHGPEKPVLLGRHLLDTIEPGPKMGKLLKTAYIIQLEEGITDWEELKQRVLCNSK